MIKKLIFIIIVIVFILIEYLFIYKEGCVDTDKQKELMIKNVQNYPNTFSVDPLYVSDFKPECCPNPYTSSSGCMCMDNQNYSLLKSRGGNNYNFKYAIHETPGTQFTKDTYS